MADDRERHAEPPLVALIREHARHNRLISRALAWSRRHRSGAAVGGAAIVVWKVARISVPAFASRDGAAWLLHHWLIAIAAGAAVFAVAFASIRLGIGRLDRWLDDDSDDRGRLAAGVGPAWAHRPEDAAMRHIPPRLG